jgi:hypothetical protein
LNHIGGYTKHIYPFWDLTIDKSESLSWVWRGDRPQWFL